MKCIVIHQNRIKSVISRHPWIYSGSIKSQDKDIQDGEIVKVISHNNEFLCYGFYNSKSKITIRAFAYDEDLLPDKEYIKLLINNSISKRSYIFNSPQTNCCRLIFSESDFLPGVIADYYNGYISASFNTASAQILKQYISEILIRETNAHGLTECTSFDFLKKEGIKISEKISIGSIPENVQVKENDIIYNVDILNGQKTGFYADQRENRQIVSKFANGKKVLDVFCYTGGFTLNALKVNAAHVTSIDSSAQALDKLKESITLNNLPCERQTSIQGDAFNLLRNLKSELKKFDLIILDPPKLAPNRHSLDEALRAYKELNLSAMQIVENYGFISVFSCSQVVSLETLKEVIRWAAIDAKKNIVMYQYLSQPPDHPISATFPESEYLKGIIYQVSS